MARIRVHEASVRVEHADEQARGEHARPASALPELDEQVVDVAEDLAGMLRVAEGFADRAEHDGDDERGAGAMTRRIADDERVGMIEVHAVMDVAREMASRRVDR